MQPQRSSRTTLVFFIFLHFLFSQVSSLDTLKQGDNLNLSSQLVSAKRIFTLGFYTLGKTHESYLAIWYTDSSYGPVWIGNRDKPIPNYKNPVLTISSKGQLVITQSGRESFELYAAESNKNLSLSATVEYREFCIEFKCFDHPTDTLLPRMKLGVNHITGQNWRLSSWFGKRNPASGAFTLEWDPIYWTSGELKNYYVELGNLRIKEFENFPRKVDVFNLNYNFSNVTSANEEYFTYSLIKDPTRTPEDRKPVDGSRDPSVFDVNYGLSVTDCREICWNDWECVAYFNDGTYGCTYWRGMKKRAMIILVVVSVIVVLISGIGLFVMRKVKQEGYTEDYELENGGAKSHDLRLFTYASIQSATRNFSSDFKPGQGSFGPGKLPEGQDIAVKSAQGLLQFKTQLILISKLQHVNLVRQLGFCIHGDDQMIIYYYMCNKSFDFSLQIIHRDLKPSNILLNENTTPKISNFALARMLSKT
ncbi:Non-specific serine/threonine protein kinase [Handroanthus impetiginosus]|uniref:Non-specific serine/threonine protein kinase n=1 Tax=Handroanthus impetiginosus TaxID=429701 RepID=A0A2G9GJQ2_9LAMI|nr:Non-specific serine/threonine protein kinase [Handroanthus impetiginosus]